MGKLSSERRNALKTILKRAVKRFHKLQGGIMRRISSNADYDKIEQFFDEVREEEINKYLDSLDEEEEE